jgi:hypothetical protein
MFANCSEYDAFLEKNCENCPFYVYYGEATEERPVCDIEESIAMGLEEVFPYEWLDENGEMSRYDCRKKQGLGKMSQ